MSPRNMVWILVEQTGRSQLQHMFSLNQQSNACRTDRASTWGPDSPYEHQREILIWYPNPCFVTELILNRNNVFLFTTFYLDIYQPV